MYLKKSFKALLATGIVMICAQSANAASCRLQDFAFLCRGCTITLDWKMRRFEKTEVRRWCRFSFGPSVNERRGFKVLDGFSLGEMRTGHDNVRVSPLRTGRDHITVQYQGVSNRGEAYLSTIHFNVEVVEGEF